MKIKRIFCKSLLLIYLTPAFDLFSADCSQGEVVVDLMDFLVQVDHDAAAKHLGYGNILGSMLSGTNPQNLKFEFFELLSQIDATKPPNEVYWENQKGPKLLYDYLTGAQTAEQILAKTKAEIERINPKNKSLMQKCAEMTFDPNINTKIMQAVPGACALLLELHQARQLVFVLANWNGQAAQHLFEAKTLRNEQTYINGDIITSGKTGKVKSGDLFKEYQTTFEPESPVYIETDQRHIDRLHELDPDAVAILHTGDFTQTRKLLVEANVLKEK